MSWNLNVLCVRLCCSAPIQTRLPYVLLCILSLLFVPYSICTPFDVRWWSEVTASSLVWGQRIDPHPATDLISPIPRLADSNTILDQLVPRICCTSDLEVVLKRKLPFACAGDRITRADIGLEERRTTATRWTSFKYPILSSCYELDGFVRNYIMISWKEEAQLRNTFLVNESLPLEAKEEDYIDFSYQCVGFKLYSLQTNFEHS